jgi:hypothetical protein
MGQIAKALSPPSAYAAKGADLWAELMDELAGCFLPVQLDALEQRTADYPLTLPAGWDAELAERIAVRREEIAAEDINEIVRIRFDFT